MNVLGIIQAATTELGLAVPPVVAGSGNPQSRQLLALLNREGAELVRSFAWSILQREFIIDLAAGQTLYPAPSDFDRMIPDTSWDRTTRWRWIGPETAQLSRARRERDLASALHRTFRRLGASIEVWPAPATSGEELVFDYVSNAWARGADGSFKTTLTADTDECVFEDDLMILGLKWRFMAAKGFGTAEQLRVEYEQRLAAARAAELGGKTLRMGEDPLCGGEITAGRAPDAILSRGGGFIIRE